MPVEPGAPSDQLLDPGGQVAAHRLVLPKPCPDQLKRRAPFSGFATPGTASERPLPCAPPRSQTERTRFLDWRPKASRSETCAGPVPRCMRLDPTAGKSSSLPRWSSPWCGLWPASLVDPELLELQHEAPEQRGSQGSLQFVGVRILEILPTLGDTVEGLEKRLHAVVSQPQVEGGIQLVQLVLVLVLEG